MIKDINAVDYIKKLSIFEGFNDNLGRILFCHANCLDALREKDLDKFKENFSKNHLFLYSSYEFTPENDDEKIDLLDFIPIRVSEEFKENFKHYEMSILSAAFFAFSDIVIGSKDWDFFQLLKKYLKKEIVDNIFANLEKGVFNNLTKEQLLKFPYLDAFYGVWQMNTILMNSKEDLEEYIKMISHLDSLLSDKEYELSRYFAGLNREGESLFIKRNDLFKMMLPSLVNKPLEQVLLPVYTLNAPKAFFINLQSYIRELDEKNVLYFDMPSMLRVLRKITVWDYVNNRFEDLSASGYRDVNLIKVTNELLTNLFKKIYLHMYGKKVDDNMLLLACLSERVKKRERLLRVNNLSSSMIIDNKRNSQVHEILLKAYKENGDALFTYLENVYFNMEIIDKALHTK